MEQIPIVTSGTVISSSVFGNVVGAAINRVGAYAKRTTALSIAGGGSVVPITFPTEVADAGGLFTAGGSVFTVPADKGGLYSCCLTVQSAVTGQLFVTVTGDAASTWTFPLESDGSASIVVPLDDGDTVEFSARNTGTTDDISLAHAHVYRVAL